jgi:hypothetical protein
MALPQRIYEDENEGEKLNALERAHKSWGMAPTTSGDDGEEAENPSSEESENTSRTALQKAEESWGEAGVHNNDKPETEGSSEEKSLFNPEDTKRKINFKGRFLNRRNAVVGGVSGVLVAGGVGWLSIVSGPLQVIHFGQLLSRFHFTSSDQATDSRVGRMVEYFRTGSDPSKRNIGYLGEKVSSKIRSSMLADGIELNFDLESGSQSRRLQAMVVNSNTRVGEATIKELETLGLRGDDAGDGKLRFAVSKSTDRVKRRALGVAVTSQNKYGKAGPLVKRLLTKRAGVDYHLLRNKSGTALIVCESGETALGKKFPSI